MVSVIMPVYNGMPYIRYSIQSLLIQTYSDWECIIINDGSTDNTQDFLDRLTDTRFVIYHFDKNRGRPSARQKGLELARGKYIAMLDADDIYHFEKLSRQVEMMENNPEISLLSGGLFSFSYEKNCTMVRGKGDSVIKKMPLSGRCPVTHANSIFRAEDVEPGTHYDCSLERGEDLDFLSKAFAGKNYMITDDILYYYSEFDSFSLSRLPRIYRREVLIACKNKKYKSFFKGGVRYLASIFIFPLLGAERVLKLRGKAPSSEESAAFVDTLNKIKQEL